MNPSPRSMIVIARRGLTAVFAILFALLSSGIDLTRAQASTSVAAASLREQRFDRLVSLVASSGKGKELGRAANLGKLDSHLQDLLAADLSGANVFQAADEAGLRLSEPQSVLVDIYLNGSLESTAASLTALGMQVMATNPGFGGVVEGYLPLDALAAAAGLEQTKAILPVLAPEPATGSVTSQGDAAHNGPAARALGLAGNDIVVGILSDSINKVDDGVAGSQLTGDLPPMVIVGTEDAAGKDEGRAMAEVIYDTAPGITALYSESGTVGGAAGKVNAMYQLELDNVDLIVDDVPIWTDPFFQDGLVSQAVDGVAAYGIAYLAAAGNRFRYSYEHNWVYGGDRTTNADYHDFDPSPLRDTRQNLGTLAMGQCFDGVLQWDEAWGQAVWDFDWYLIDAVTDVELAWSTSSNYTTKMPIESLHWCNPGPAPISIADRIVWYHGSYGGPEPTNVKLKFIVSQPITEYNTASPAIAPDAASANGALTVAAVRYDEPGLNDPEADSSRGPVTRLFSAAGVRLAAPEVRQKPQVAGADCVITSNNFAGGGPFAGGSFCGTSAAVASVAGVAALILDANPSLTPAQLYGVLANAGSTIDCTAAGNPDPDCGYGFLQADKAVTTLGNTTSWYGSVRIDTDRTIVAVARPHVGAEVASYTGVQVGSTSLYSYVPMLFKDAFGGSYDSALYIQNVDPDPAHEAHVIVKYYDTNGVNTCTKPVDFIPPNSSHGTWLPAETCLPAGWVGSAVVTSSNYYIAAVARLHVGGEVMTYNGFPSSQADWFLPMLFKNAFGGSYNSAFYVQNLSAASEEIWIYYYDTSGNLMCLEPIQDTLPGMATRGYWLPSVACLPDGWVGSVKVEGGDLVVAARPHVGSQVTTYNALGYEGATGGKYYLPMLFKTAYGGTYNSAVYLQNEESAAATVSIDYYDSSGVKSCGSGNFSLPAHATQSYWLPSVACLPQGWVGGAVITSDKPVATVARPHVGAQVTTYSGINAGTYTASLPMLFKKMWGSYNSAFYIQNIDTINSAAVSLTYYDVAGNRTCARTLSIPALAVSGIWVPSEICLHEPPVEEPE